MFPKTPTGKASKGTVSVSSNQNRLRLNLPRALFGGQRKYITLHLADTPENRAIAENKALQANLDIQNNQFDFSFERYKIHRQQALPKEVKQKPELGLIDLWRKYVAFKKPEWAISTLGKQVAQATRHISRLPTQSIKDAIAIRDYLLEKLARNAAKRLLVQLSAACKWGIKSKLIDSNPFAELAADIKLPKRDDESDVNPFTVSERDAIIKAFETNQFSRYQSENSYSHSSYAPYVKFCFFTGCRPSEAIALTWGDISDYIHFTKAVVNAGKKGTVQKPGLKTQEKRKFPISEQLNEILQSIKPEDAKPTDLVFNRGNGKYLNQNSFRGIWQKILKELGIPYRKPYQTRHTFITMQVASNQTDTIQIARWVGTSTQMIEKHYLGDTSHIKPSAI